MDTSALLSEEEETFATEITLLVPKRGIHSNMLLSKLSDEKMKRLKGIGEGNYAKALRRMSSHLMLEQGDTSTEFYVFCRHPKE